MKRKLFDKDLYLEAMRQLRTPGIFFLVVNALAAILITMGRWVTELEFVANRPGMLPLTWDPMIMQPLLFTGFFLIAPVLTLRIFNFTRDRKGSDFYHALPETRLCIFFSFYAAVLTYLTVIIMGTGILAGRSTYFYPGWFQFSWADLLTYAFSMLVTSFYVAAAVACGTFLSGTAFTNIAVALLLIFAPRLILLVFTMNVGYACPVLNTDYLPFVFSYQYNMVFGLVGNFFSSLSLNVVYSWPSIWYTLVIGVIYTACAAMLFHFRKSEAAGVAAPNRFLGAVYRLTVTFVFCLIPITLIFQSVKGGRSMSSVEIFQLVVLYIVAVIIFFAYELIASRKVASLVKALPSLVFVPVLNVAALVVLFSVVSMVNGYRPEASEISAVRIVEGMGGSEDYFQQMISKADLKDEACRKAASEGLKRMLDMKQSSLYNEGYDMYTVAIKTGAGWKYRNIALSDEEVLSLSESLNGSDIIKDVYMNLPKAGMGSGVNVLTQDAASLSTEDRMNLYETMRQEVQEMGFDAWYRYLQTFYGENVPLDTMVVTVTRSGKSGSFRVPIKPEMPKTFERYCALRIAGTGVDNALAFIERLNKADNYTYANMTVSVWDYTEKPYEQFYLTYAISGGGEPGVFYNQYNGDKAPLGTQPMSDLLKELSGMKSEGSAIGSRIIMIQFNGAAYSRYYSDSDTEDNYFNEDMCFRVEGDLPKALELFDSDPKYREKYGDDVPAVTEYAE